MGVIENTFALVFAFILVVGILVTVHEWGHYIVAKKLGVKVLRFSVGFGKPIWSKRWGTDQTEYVVAAIPLGGYVKMLDEAEGEVAPAEQHRAFNRQPLWVRTAVVFAGPLMNLVFAVLAFYFMLIIGLPGLKPIIGQVDPASPTGIAGVISGDEIIRVNDVKVGTWQHTIQLIIDKSLTSSSQTWTLKRDGIARQVVVDFGERNLANDLPNQALFEGLGFEPFRPKVEPVVGVVHENSPASKAGFLIGDHIISADNQDITSWNQWVEYVQGNPLTPISVTVQRNNEPFNLVVVPNKVSKNGLDTGFIGLGIDPAKIQELKHYYTNDHASLFGAIPMAFTRTYEACALTAKFFVGMLTMQVSVKNLSGPIGIAQVSKQALTDGLVWLLRLMAFISVSLAILNLLPIPVLDGGHLLYYLIEFVTGKPPGNNLMIVGQYVGLVFIIGLATIAIYNDINRILG